MIAAIILAGGLGSRFGGGKMLAEIDGRPMLQHVLDLAAAAQLDPVVVILGDDAEAIDATIRWRNEVRIRNQHPERGISSSLKLGLEALSHADRALVLLGDQPFVAPENVRLITALGRNPARPVVVPRYGDGLPGNPVLLEREAWPLALKLKGDRGMSQLFGSHPELVRYVDVEGDNPDIDSQADMTAVSRGGG